MAVGTRTASEVGWENEDNGGTVSDSESASGLLGPAQIRRLADQLGVAPTKKLGQNFVHDAGTVRRIVSLARVRPGDVVLEVGPGLGSLTLGLLEAGATVEAVELDRRLAGALPRTVADRAPATLGALRVRNADGLSIRSEWFREPPTRFVANLPYNVAVPILLTALGQVPSLHTALVMVQKEVADRLTAPPGSRVYGAPSAKLAWFGSARRVGTVGPSVFWPKPNVDSALVSLDCAPPPGDGTLRERTFALVDAAFEQRRKMLRASLRDFWCAAEGHRIFNAAGVDETARPEQLGIDAFVALARADLESSK